MSPRDDQPEQSDKNAQTKSRNGRRSWIREPFSRRRRVWTVGALLLTAAVIWGVATAFERPTVTVVPVSRGPAVEAVYATGVIEPVHWAKVAPTIVGRIAEVDKRDGAKVKKGDVLMRLDDREAKANLAQLEARLKFSREELDRYQALVQRRIASQQAYERARSDHIQALAAVAAARQRLNDYTLTAPLDGIVLRHDGEVGETVSAGQVLYWVGREYPLRVVAEVDEEDIPLVKLGQKALLTADAFGERVFAGKVAEITPKGDPVNKNYRVRVAIPDTTPLRIGMTTEVNIVVQERKRALLVPFSALRKGAVFTVVDGRARRKTVNAGIVGDTQVEIRGGLLDGELVIVNPPEGLEDGDRVRAKPATPAS
jgi:RND family efflux transporter MFP subunit